MAILGSVTQLTGSVSSLPKDVLSSLDVSSIAMVAGAVLALVKPRGLSSPSRMIRWTGLAILGAALLSSVLVLLEFATKVDFGLEALLMPALDREAGAPASVAVPLAFAFAFLGAVLLMRFRVRPPKNDVADYLALVVAASVSLFVVTRLEMSTAPPEIEGSCLISALTLLAVAVSVVVTRPHGSIMRIATSNAITAQLMRPLLIVTVVTPTAVDHLTMTLANLGTFTAHGERALCTLLCTFVLLGVTIVITRIVARTEFAREDAQKKLRESESRLKLQFERMPIACMTRDTEYRVISWNPAAEGVFGYTAEEMIGRSSDILVRPELLEYVATKRREALAGNWEVQVAGEAITRDGRTIVCRWSNAPLIDEQGNVFAIVSMVEDITAQEEARKAVLESEQRYRMLVENSPDAIFVHRAGDILFANPSASRLLGAGSSSVIGASIFDFIVPEARTAMMDAVQQMTSTRQAAFHPEIQLRRLDAGFVEADLTAIPIDFANEPSVLIIAHDVTERKAAEHARQESERRYRTVVESAPDGIVVRVGDGIVFANSSAGRLLGCEPFALVGKTALDLVHPDDVAALRMRWQNVDEVHECAGVGEYRAVRFDGTTVEVEVAGGPMTWFGQPATQLIFRDVSERNAARRALQSSEERYRRVVDHAPDPIVVHGDGRILYANRAAATLVNAANPDDVVGATLLSFVHPQSRWAVMERIQIRRENPSDVLQFPLDVRWMDGRLINADITAVPIDYAGVSAVLLHIHDVTSSKQALAALRSSEERYRRVVESMNEGLAVLDDEHRTVFANDQFCRIVDLPAEEFVGEHASAHWAPECGDAVRERLERRRQGFSDRDEVTFRRRSGSEISISVSASPLMENGRYLGSVVLVNDITDRVHTEQALRQSEERYRMLVEYSPDAIVVHSAGRLVFANPAAAALIGAADPELFVGRMMLDFVDPARHAEVESRIQNRGDLPVRYESRLKSMDGSIVDVDVTSIPIAFKGENDATLVVLRDITASKQAEERLRKSEERYRELFDSSPNFIFSVDNENRYLTVNRAVCDAFGRPADQIIGHTPFEMDFPQEAAADWADAQDIVRRSGMPHEHDTAIRHADGRTIITRSLLSPLRDETGACIGVSGIAIDITEQTLARQSEQRLLRAIEQIEEIMFTTDVEGRITYVNPAFERVYGFTHDESIGRTPRILKSGQVPPRHYEELWQSILSGNGIRAEYLNRRKDGTLVTVIGSAAPVFDKARKITGFIAIQQDVTAQRAMEESQRRLDEQLHHLAKMEALGRLAGGVAHDFNNILSIILSHATAIEHRAGDAQRVESGVATIRKAVQRGGTLAKQILTFARRTDLNSEPVQMTTIFSELASMVRETFPRNTEVSFTIEPDLPPIQGDVGQIQQALLNLCLNARDAMPSGGKLALKAHLVSEAIMSRSFDDRPGGDFIAVVISDTGTGMDKETQARIFEPFFTTKAKGQGTGLGLAMAYGVIKAHSGYIEVDSAPGRGTEFRLFFPAMQHGVRSDDAPSSQRMYQGDESILLVDDEQALLHSLAECLRDSGYRVVEASIGDEALERCRVAAVRIDGVIMDIGMPGLPAIETIPALRKIVPEVPIIAMTGYIDPDLHSRVIAAGASRIMQKPFDTYDLLGALREALDRVARRAPAAQVPPVTSQPDK